MKSPEMSPPIKDPITNQDSTRIITQQEPTLLPLLEKWTTGYKSFIDDTKFSNKSEDEHNDSTDNSRLYYYAIIGWWNTIYQRGSLLFNKNIGI